MPYYRFDIDSPFPPGTVIQRLRALTREMPDPDPSRTGPIGKDRRGEAVFVGALGEDGFRLRRDIRHRNTFRPQIRGQLDALPSGTRIRVRMRLHLFAVLFMAAWLTFVGYGCFRVLSDGRIQPPAAWIPVGMLVVGVLMPFVFFYPEAIRARRLLERAVDVRPPL